MEQITVRQIGNSIGFSIPKPLATRLRLKVGQVLPVRIEDHELILVLPERPRYALADLIAQCDPAAPLPEDLEDWDAAPSVGRELP